MTKEGEMMDTLVAAIICILGLIIGIFAIRENELFSIKKKCMFVVLAFVIIFEISSDTLLLLINGKNILSDPICTLLKAIELIVVPIIPTIFSVIITHKNFWKKIRKVFIAIIALNTAFQLMSFVLPISFQYQNTFYSRTQYTYIYITLIVLSTILFLICASKTFVQSTKISYTLVSSVVLVLLGMLFRMLHIDSNADWMCITLAYFIFLFYFSSTYLKVDPLTSLLNRKAMDSRIEKINYDTAIIMIDANNFKEINDTYGHIAGDKALTRIAKAIYITFENYGYCYRIGGDEFCVILKRNALSKLVDETENFDTYNAIGGLIAKLDEQMEIEAQKYPMLSDGLACGFGIYKTVANSEELDTYKTVEEVKKIADERMYKKKEMMKEDKKTNKKKMY